jgi:hypothetical protein
LTTVIQPATGAGLLFTQQGVGTTPGYSALDDRRSNSGSLQEGVYGTPTLVTAGGVANTPDADFMVTQRAAGANLSIDVNMPSGGFAYVQGDTISGQGLYTVPVHASNINEAIAAADATNPRVDSVILELQDNVHDGSGGNGARTRVLTGTPTPGATLANRSGAVALPGSALLLADVLVGNGVTTLANAVMRDRRKWARGAYLKILRNSNAAAGNDYTTTSTTDVLIDGTNLQPRIECSGAPLRISLRSSVQNLNATDLVDISYKIDGAAIDGGALFELTSAVAGQDVPFSALTDTIPAAGSHLVAPYWHVNLGTGKLLAQSGVALVFVVEELVRQNTANNVVTTG